MAQDIADVLIIGAGASGAAVFGPWPKLECVSYVWSRGSAGPGELCEQSRDWEARTHRVEH